MGEEKPVESMSLPIVWVGLDEQPVYAANQFLVQLAGEEFLLGLGHVAPPALIGSDEEIKKSAERLEYVPVRPISRIGLNRQRVGELIDLLQRVAKGYDDAHD